MIRRFLCRFGWHQWGYDPSHWAADKCTRCGARRANITWHS